MTQRILIITTLCIALSACAKDIVTKIQDLGELSSSESVIGDFVVEKRGILPLMTIVAIPKNPDVDLWVLEQAEIWPDQTVVTFCDSDGMLIQLVSDFSIVQDDDELRSHLPGREIDVLGQISYYRDFRRYRELWEKASSSLDFVDFLGELIPDGKFDVEVHWSGFSPSPEVGHYEFHFYNRMLVPEWRLWFDRRSRK